MEQVLAELDRAAAAHAHRVSGSGLEGLKVEALCAVRHDELKAIKSRLGVDHRLARRLWHHGTCLARVFATMIADPDQADDRLLDEWAGDLDGHVLADALAVYTSRTRFARVMAEAWIASRDEWREHAGWQILVQLALRDHGLSDAYFEHYLPLAERGFHATPRGVRGARSMALRTIGLRSARLEEKATEVSQRLGLG